MNPRGLLRWMDKRLDALDGHAEGARGPQVLFLIPDDGSGSPGFDGDGIDPPSYIGRRHLGGAELHVFDFETGDCGFLGATGSRCGDDHRQPSTVEGADAGNAESNPGSGTT